MVFYQAILCRFPFFFPDFQELTGGKDTVLQMFFWSQSHVFAWIVVPLLLPLTCLFPLPLMDLVGLSHLFILIQIVYPLSQSVLHKFCIMPQNIYFGQKYIAKTPTMEEQPPTVLSEPFSSLISLRMGQVFIFFITSEENHFFSPLT